MSAGHRQAGGSQTLRLTVHAHVQVAEKCGGRLPEHCVRHLGAVEALLDPLLPPLTTSPSTPDALQHHQDMDSSTDDKDPAGGSEDGSGGGGGGGGGGRRRGRGLGPHRPVPWSHAIYNILWCVSQVMLGRTMQQRLKILTHLQVRRVGCGMWGVCVCRWWLWGWRF